MPEIIAKNSLHRLMCLRQFTSGFVRTDGQGVIQIDSAKMDLLREVLGGIAEPVIVFAWFIHDLDAIKRIAAELNIACLELSGRRDELKRWQAGEAPVLAVQIESGGAGVDLTRARIAVYYSLSFSLGTYLQSLARVHRPGQTKPVTYIHFIAKGTIDEKVMNALAAREEVVESVLRQMKEEQ